MSTELLERLVICTPPHGRNVVRGKGGRKKEGGRGARQGSPSLFEMLLMICCSYQGENECFQPRGKTYFMLEMVKLRGATSGFLRLRVSFVYCRRNCLALPSRSLTRVKYLNDTEISRA